MPELQTILEQAGQAPVTLTAPGDDSRLLVLPRSGRVLGLFAVDSAENFLWTNGALATPASARAYFAGSGWLNPGGDRTWLAPELELFIGDPQRVFETYAVQRELDPGNWTLAAASGTDIRLTNTACLQLHRSRSQAGVRLTKTIRTAPDPLAVTPLATAGLLYAGYAQETTLVVEGVAAPAARLGIWNLLQLPPPGTMLIPTRSLATPQVVFGTTSAGELLAEPALVRWHMTGPGTDAKVSLKAAPLTGRAGYLRQRAQPDSWDLVVRDFTVDPAGDYVDALWWPPYETGWAFQACRVAAGTERFNELEYHVPAVAGGVCRDESRVWAYRGPREAILAAARELLGLEPPLLVQ